MENFVSNIEPEQLNKITDAFALVEAKLPGFATGNPRIDIPALNEIRYAFQHFLRALNGKGDENTHNAVKHLTRALYDCYQSEAIYVLKQWTDFDDAYQSIYIPTYVPSYVDWVAAYEDLKDAAAQKPDDREKYCQNLENYLVVVRPIHKQLLSSRRELQKVVNLEAEKLVAAQEAAKRADAESARKDIELTNRTEELRIAREQLETSRHSLDTSKKSAASTRSAALAGWAAACVAACAVVAAIVMPTLAPSSVVQAPPVAAPPTAIAPSSTLEKKLQIDKTQ